MHTRVSVKECLLSGWRIFMARPWLFFGTGLIYVLVQMVMQSIQRMVPGVGAVASLVIGVFVSIGFMTLYLKAHDDVAHTRFSALWNPKPFWSYLGTTILVSLVVAVGFVLLIVPGIILSIGLSFSLYLVVERGRTPVTAMKESWRITKGHRLELFLLMLALLVVNVIGAGLLLVGLFVSVPVSMLAVIHAYRSLESHAHATDAVAA